MAVGCVHFFIVVKRSAAIRVLDKVTKENDQERIKFARLMLSMVHSDQHLIAIEDTEATTTAIYRSLVSGQQAGLAVTHHAVAM